MAYLINPKINKRRNYFNKIFDPLGIIYRIILFLVIQTGVFQSR